MLINLSNHPSSMWDIKQINAAREYGQIIDMPFPAVDEQGDEEYISALAEYYLHKILAMADEVEIAVHLMGELTFTYALLYRLQTNGIKCIASTSKRIVNDETPSRKGEVIFQFARFREYEKK